MRDEKLAFTVTLLIVLLFLNLAGCGVAKKVPWSGGWWPMRQGKNNLYATNGPLEKYDKYVKAKYGYSPGAKDWEADPVHRVAKWKNPYTGISGLVPVWIYNLNADKMHSVYEDYLDENIMESALNYDANGNNDKKDSWDINLDGKLTNLTPDGVGWWGHCHAWSKASILEDEPTKTVTKQGITFTVGDLKGLLAECQDKTPSDWMVGTRGERGNPDILSAVDFHNALRDWLAVDKIIVKEGIIREIRGEKMESIVMDKSPGKSVWNHPICLYIMMGTPDLNDSNKTHIKCLVGYADDPLSPYDYVGTKLEYVTYFYYILGPIDNPTGGDWEEGSVQDHPGFLWHPTSNLNLWKGGNAKLDCNIVRSEIIK